MGYRLLPLKIHLKTHQAYANHRSTSEINGNMSFFGFGKEASYLTEQIMLSVNRFVFYKIFQMSQHSIKSKEAR